jgi:hypothetical protein
VTNSPDEIIIKSITYQVFGEFGEFHPAAPDPREEISSRMVTTALSEPADQSSADVQGRPLYQQELDAITEAVPTIARRYQDQLAQMDAAVQAQLAPLQERVQRLRHVVEVAMGRFHPALPLRPDADTEPVDEETWLFDGQREYLT